MGERDVYVSNEKTSKLKQRFKDIGRYMYS